MPVIIDNTPPRRDIHGDIIDAHDGSIEYWDGLYYLYGTRYGTGDGYGLTNRFVAYTSPDLTHWTPLGIILPDPPPGVYFRPYVKRSPLTHDYVLWFNWIEGWRGTKDFSNGDGPTSPGRLGVAVADRPEGPFIIHTMDAKIHAVGAGDFNLFTDQDGTGYIIHTDKETWFSMRVERLAPDYRSGTGECSEVLGEVVEAPAMFQRDGWYCVLFGTLCCFCPQGSGAMVFRSRSPLGPYEYRNNINRLGTQPGVAEDKGGTPIVPAQQTAIVALPSGEYLWMGDCWESAPDGIKGHDFQYWEPLRFDADNDILPLTRIPNSP